MESKGASARIVEPVVFQQQKVRYKRTAVYCRVSSRMDEQLRSIGGQAKYLIDMVIRHPGWIYQGVFIDICTGSVQIREQNCRGCSQNAEPG